MHHAQAADTSGAGERAAVVALHQRLMADDVIHARMAADPQTRALMSQTMPRMNQAGGLSGHVAGLSPADRDALVARMRAAHARLMSDPDAHTRMMDDPDIHVLMMRTMPDMDHSAMQSSDGMQGMDHGSMSGMSGDMTGMDHGSMTQMDHSRMSEQSAELPPVNPDAFDVSAVTDRFHAALASGDRAAVESLLTADAVVLEGGAAESRAEYLSHHFARDAAFLAGKTSEPLFRRTTVAGSAAWTASRSRVGEVEMAELLVLRREPDGWRVAAVHWSSARN